MASSETSEACLGSWFRRTLGSAQFQRTRRCGQSEPLIHGIIKRSKKGSSFSLDLLIVFVLKLGGWMWLTDRISSAMFCCNAVCQVPVLLVAVACLYCKFPPGDAVKQLDSAIFFAVTSMDKIKLIQLEQLVVMCFHLFVQELPQKHQVSDR